MTIDYQSLLKVAITAAESASEKTLEVYHSGNFQAAAKGDNSPLTLADTLAHHAIVEILKSSTLPVLSEEGKDIPFSIRKNWDYFWLVDPLDGTKEFIKRNGEFTVNIALIHQNVPVLGVVAVPVTGDVYYGFKGHGAFKKSRADEVRLAKRTRVDLQQTGLRVVGSRSHMNPETEEFMKSLHLPVLVSAGSSLKFMLIANNQADIYPRFAPTMEWDTAASQVIISEIGLAVQHRDSGEDLRYNKESLLNPHFLVF